MVNAFKIKKWGALCISAMMPTILFFIALISFGFFYAIVFFLVGVVLSIVLGSVLLRHPLIGMAEASGLGIFTFDSTGLIKPYLAKVNAPYINSLIDGRRFASVFDRNTVNYLAEPEKAEVSIEKGENGKEDEIVIRLPKSEYAQKMFSFSGAFPVLFFNKVLGEFYSKDMLANLETQTFVQHLVLYLNRKVDELSNSIRDFARYVVEQTKPKTSFFQSKLFWVVIIIVLGLLLLAFAPNIMKTLSTVQVPSLPSQPITPTGG